MSKVKNKVLYLCDRQKCRKCYNYCTHTSDINHAVNFTKHGEHIFEKEVSVKSVDCKKKRGVE